MAKLFSNIIFGALSMSVALIALPAHGQDGRIGVAAAVRNEVTAQGAQTRALQTGAPVFQQELIRTGASSVAQLLFLDETSLSIGPRSEVRLDRYVYNPDQSVGDVLMTLTNGALRFISGRQDPSSYSVQTPVATIGVRGTIVDFLLIDGRMFAILAEGAALFTLANGQQVRLDQPGKAIEFFSDGTVSRPFTWRGRYEAGLQAASFPLFGNPFADMPWRIGGDNPDDRINRTDELESRESFDFQEFDF